MTKAEGHLLGCKPEAEEENWYLKQQFCVKTFASTSLDLNRSTLGRIHNQLVKAINQEIILPKAIVIILDNDLILATKYTGFGTSDIYGRIIHWLSNQFAKLVAIQKDRLPKKALKPDYPTFIWMAPPTNVRFPDNESRIKMAKSIKNVIKIIKIIK